MFRAALLAREEEIDTGTIETLLNSASVENAVSVDGNIDALVAAWLPVAGLPDGDIYHRALAVLEKPLFEHALTRTGGNQLRAAQLLGINRNTLRKRLGELEIDPERFSS
jgi:two-component system nitrogen regulation response regulator GlnG